MLTHTNKVFLQTTFLVAALTATNLSAPAKQQEPIATFITNKSKVIKFGDPFSITVVPKEKSFIFLFYVDEHNNAISLYPGREINYRIVTPDDPLVVSSITNKSIKIDSEKGKLISVAVKFSKNGRLVKKKVLKDSDFSAAQPIKHKLSLTGDQLINRLEFLRADYPIEFHYLVEDAPRSINKHQM